MPDERTLDVADSPLEPFFAKKWRPGEVELVK
jgi:hypothetical protein